MGDQLIDAKAAGELLGVPHTWLLREARRDACHTSGSGAMSASTPQLLAWARNRARGPVYPEQQYKGGPGGASTPRGPTPKE